MPPMMHVRDFSHSLPALALPATAASETHPHEDGPMTTRLLAAALLAACAGCSNIDIAMRGGDIGQARPPKQSRQSTDYSGIQQAAYTETAGQPGGMVQQAMLVEQPGMPGNVMLVGYPGNYCPNCSPGGYGQGYGYGGYGHHHGGSYGPWGGAHHTPGYPHHHFSRSYIGPQGPPTPQVAYPYYTTRGPRDFLLDNPPSIGR